MNNPRIFSLSIAVFDYFNRFDKLCISAFVTFKIENSLKPIV